MFLLDHKGHPTLFCGREPRRSSVAVSSLEELPNGKKTGMLLFQVAINHLIDIRHIALPQAIELFVRLHEH